MKLPNVLVSVATEQFTAEQLKFPLTDASTRRAVMQDKRSAPLGGSIYCPVLCWTNTGEICKTLKVSPFFKNKQWTRGIEVLEDIPVDGPLPLYFWGRLIRPDDEQIEGDAYKDGCGFPGVMDLEINFKGCQLFVDPRCPAAMVNTAISGANIAFREVNVESYRLRCHALLTNSTNSSNATISAAK